MVLIQKQRYQRLENLQINWSSSNVNGDFPKKLTFADMRVRDKNQLMKQAGFRSGYSTMNHADIAN